MTAFTGSTVSQRQHPISPGEHTPGMILSGQRRSYRIKHLLARTASNAIYLATDLATQRRVVIKGSMEGRRGDQVPCKALADEGQMLDQLERARIVAPRRLDTFMFRCRTYLVMTYIVGDTLAALHQSGRLDKATVLKIMTQICETCQRLHVLGYVHHDVKPENIMVTQQGVAILIDYGSARLVRPVGDQQHDVTGTWGFMSLEQMRGEARPRNDLFAIRRTLEMVMPEPARWLDTVMQRVTPPLEMQYKTLSELRRSLIWVQRVDVVVSTCSDLVAGCVPVARRMLIVALIAISFLAVRGHVFRGIGAAAREPLPPLQSAFARTVAAPELSSVFIPAQPSASPVQTDLIRDCYRRYQESRIVAFTQLDVSKLTCVVPESPLWQRIAAEIASLKQRGYSREIVIHASANSVTQIGVATATVTVQKDETRRDVPSDCQAAQTQPHCHSFSIAHDQFGATFSLQNISGSWWLNDVTLVMPSTSARP